MTADVFAPEPDSAYIFASGQEERAAHVESWGPHRSDVTLVRITEQNDARMTAEIGAIETVAFLRSQEQLRGLLDPLADVIYIDITGLAHHVWAPLVRAAISLSKRLFAIYVEPGEYKRASAPTEGTIYDLSERTLGIRPLPGFAILTDVAEEDYVFAPLLGFEGTRFFHVAEHVQPSREATFPIVGVPGFRAEYPGVTLKGNMKPLLDDSRFVNIEHCTANCPFDLFFLLRDIYLRSGARLMGIAPIGTKPHGLGAVLFALSAEDRVELIYDHPIRKAGRTTGSARLCLYDVSTFTESDEFRWAATP